MSEVYLDLIEVEKKSCFAKVLYLLSVPLGLFLFIVAGYLNLIPFRVESHSIAMIGAIFIIYLFFLKHNAFYATCKFLQDKDIFKRELKKFIEKNWLEISHTKKANAKFDDFVTEFTYDLRNDNFASVAAGIFPTLGILGTFISIAISMPDFSSKTSAVLEQEISLLLGGVGTAFYVSIYGIFLSIWWVLFDKNGLSKFEKIISKIKRETKNLFWTKEEIEQTYFKKSMENYEKLNQLFQNLGKDDLVESMNKTLEQRINMFEKIIEYEQKALQSVNSELNSSVELLSKTKSSTQEVISNLKEVVEEFKQASSIMKLSSNSLESISNSLKIKDENLADIANSLKSIDAKNMEQIYESIVKNFEIMKKDTEQIGYTFNAYLNEFDEKFYNRLKETLHVIDSEVAKIVQSLEKVRQLES